jgi:hypothetical protein
MLAQKIDPLSVSELHLREGAWSLASVNQRP